MHNTFLLLLFDILAKVYKAKILGYIVITPSLLLSSSLASIYYQYYHHYYYHYPSTQLCY